MPIRLLLDLLIEKNLGVHLLIETKVEDIIRDADMLHKYRAAGIIHIHVFYSNKTQEIVDLEDGFKRKGVT